MSDTAGNKPPRTIASAAERILARRWLFAAALLALAVLAVADAHRLPIALILALFLVAVAAFSPNAPRQARDSAAPADLTGRAVRAVDLAEAVADPLILFEESGAVVHANAAANAAFGPFPPGLSLLLKFRQPELRTLIEAVLAANGTPPATDYIERLPVERAYQVEAVAVGEGDLFVLIFRDQSAARRIDRMRADFIANASHELRTPLASVAGFIETLMGPARNDPAARARFLPIMREQTARMARLIDDLLSLSRLETRPLLRGGPKLDLKALVDGVIDALAPLAGESGVAVERDYPAEPIEVEGDRNELIQVFENLIENACKYGRSGGRIVVSMARITADSGPEAVVTVRDFGPGIAPEHLPRLTERFYRADAEASRAQRGTGLGLAIVKHILTRHGGRLSIKSQPGEGSSFSAHLPTR